MTDDSLVAAQAAHDIRSPLAALKAGMASLGAVDPEVRNLLAQATSRIEEIVHELSGLVPLHGRAPALLRDVVERIVAEKRATLTVPLKLEVVCETGAEDALSLVNACELSRALSNLLDNAIQASAGADAVTISLGTRGGFHQIIVADRGEGIPSHLVPRLGNRGVSYGKAGGSGLGLFHARNFAKNANGWLMLISAPGRGTQVSLNLPAA